MKREAYAATLTTEQLIAVRATLIAARARLTDPILIAIYTHRLTVVELALRARNDTPPVLEVPLAL